MAFDKKDTATYDIQEVRNVHAFEGGNVGFSLKVNGIWIHNMVIVNTENAEDGWFISFPSRKSSDDKYYNYAYFSITPEVKKTIGDMVKDMI